MNAEIEVDEIRYNRWLNGPAAIRPLFEIIDDIESAYELTVVELSNPPTDDELDHYVRTGWLAPTD
jgi:hypothetical protein